MVADHDPVEVPARIHRAAAVDDIETEIRTFFEVGAAEGVHPGGVHLEMTGSDVTECIGGARNLTEEDLQRAYRSQVDPRLNYEQALEMALLIARHGER